MISPHLLEIHFPYLSFYSEKIQIFSLTLCFQILFLERSEGRIGLRSESDELAIGMF